MDGEDLNGFVEQVRLSLKAYKKEQMGTDIQQIILVSDFLETRLLREKIEQVLKVKTVMYSSMHEIPVKKT